jgi:hypothetical protein
MREPITVLSFGGGQDSTALLVLLLFDAEFRAKYAPGRLLVVMSDTGDEHSETYEHVARVMKFCQPFEWVEFYFITPDMGFHPKTWTSLRFQMERNDTIMSKGFSKTCTSNLKIVPIYNFIDSWIGTRYGYGKSRKGNIKKYVQEFGKLRVMIGIAGGEESRLGGEMPNKWMNDCIERFYPLVEMGADRAHCQLLIDAYGMEVPPPSNCILCPWMSKQELLYLYRFMRADYEYYVVRERAKMAKPVPEGRANLGVFGRKTLPETLEIALKRYGHWTEQELREYKFSHGHCVKSKY